DLGLGEMRVVGSAPSPAIVTTLAEVGKASTDGAVLKRFTGRDVLLRVKVSQLEKAGAYLGKVTDPYNPAAPAVLVRRQGQGTFARELAALKVGDEVAVLAGVQGGGVFALALMDVRIITQPPAGLKMPSGKK